MMRLRQRNEQDDNHGPEMLAYVMIYCAAVLAWPAGYMIVVIASWLR